MYSETVGIDGVYEVPAEFLAADPDLRRRSASESLAMAVPQLLAELLLAPGASGYEEPVQAIVRREAEAIGAEISTDVLGHDDRDREGHGWRSHPGALRTCRPGRRCRCATRASDGCSRSRSSRTGAPATRARPARADRDGRRRGSRRRRRAARGRARRGRRCGSTSARPIVSRRSSSCVPAIRSCSTGRPRRCRTARALGRARRPGRHLRRPRGAATRCRRPARVGRRARRDRAGGEQPRRAHVDCAATPPGGRDRGRGHICGRCAGLAPWGVTSSSAAGRPSSAVRLSVRSSSEGLLAIAARDGITVAIETGGATHRDAETCSSPATGSPRDGLDPAAVHALGRRDRPALGRRRRVAADRGVRCGRSTAETSFLR